MSSAAPLRYHDEVHQALAKLANDSGISLDRGERVRADRQSSYQYFGVRTPDRRRLVSKGFSFTDQPVDEVLAAWDAIWHAADNGDVLFAVLDYYRSKVAVSANEEFWNTAVRWIARIDNWAHADDLARLYSFVLEALPDLVYPELLTWSQTDNEWLRRVSMVSLIHYTGKNAVFMPIVPVLDLVASCVDDRRETVSKAVGWVLREMMAEYPADVVRFLETHAGVMPADAIRRATEKLPTAERNSLRASLRNAADQHGS